MSRNDIHRLVDYRPPPYLIPRVNLIMELDPHETKVIAELQFKKNGSDPCPELFLNGVDLKLKSIKMDGVANDNYRLEPTGLTLLNPQPFFTLETEVIIHPESNTCLEGLYLSEDILCTQCEAEGFRRITYTLDRPDVLSTYSVTLIADGKQYPVLLSNGDRIPEKSGHDADGRLREVFFDPFPKPSYLFAIVAGKLDELKDNYTTLSSRRINLTIYSEPGEIHKCGFAMKALKAAMKWEEENYGLEYDLNDYKIVAVSSFNLGAMENKGLNIFNSALVFYDETTATDSDKERVAVTIAHEYFHNWTGNRVTVRDWFQLTLKEGLTVYRDRCFSADYFSPTVIRIQNAILLRSFQFPEDNGPLSHPIRSETYESINNFYTLTVYEKGAEVVGMYESILGKRKFLEGVKQYLTLYDGQATTVEDFFASMQAMTHQDLHAFMRWYHTSGTPEIRVDTEYRSGEKTFLVHLTQSIPNKPEANPLLIPLAFSVNIKRGDKVTSAHHGLWLLQEKQETRIFTDIESPPRISLNENFSAPVKIIQNFTFSEWIEQFRCEKNPFLKWDVLQQGYLALFMERLKDPHLNIEEPIRLLSDVMKPIWDPILFAFRNKKSAISFLKSGPINHQYYGDASFLAELLKFPGFTELLDNVGIINFDIIQLFIEDFKRIFVRETELFLEEIYTTINEIHMNDTHDYLNEFFPTNTPEITGTGGRRNLVGERKLKNTCLKWLAEGGRQDLALAQLKSAQGLSNVKSNFNDELLAFKSVLLKPNALSEEAIRDFYQRWHKDNLVINRWIEAQAEIDNEKTLKKVVELQKLPEFSLREPNKCRALFLSFIRNNPFVFNHPSGEGYRIITDAIICLDPINPISASALLTYWPSLKKLDEPNQSLMRREMMRIQNSCRSKDVLEIVKKRLNL